MSEWHVAQCKSLDKGMLLYGCNVTQVPRVNTTSKETVKRSCTFVNSHMLTAMPMAEIVSTMVATGVMASAIDETSSSKRLASESQPSSSITW